MLAQHSTLKAASIGTLLKCRKAGNPAGVSNPAEVCQ
jgi:hypothetical protein